MRRSVAGVPFDNAMDGSYQPLTRPIFIYVSTRALKTKPYVAEFVAFYLNKANAAKLIKEVGYVPLPGHAYDVFLQRVHPKDRETVDRAWQMAIKGSAPYDIDYRIRRHDGVYRRVGATPSAPSGESRAVVALRRASAVGIARGRRGDLVDARHATPRPGVRTAAAHGSFRAASRLACRVSRAN